MKTLLRGRRVARMARRLWLSLSVLLIGTGIGIAQERDLSSPYFDCPYINYFDSGCPELEREREAVAPPRVQPEQEEPAVAGDQQEDEYEWPEENPELLLPLFPKESLAPDTPPLYRLLLMRPTLENARLFVRWYSERMARVREVQELIGLAGREYLAEKAASE